jgi:hypothetical protein
MVQSTQTVLRWLASLVGLAAVLGALVSLCLPMALGVVDRTGTPIACGTGYHPDSTVAGHEDALNHQEHHLVGAQYMLSNYTGECGGLIAERRRLAAGVGGVGAVLVLVAVGRVIAVSLRPTPRRADPNAGSLSSYAAS